MSYTFNFGSLEDIDFPDVLDAFFDAFLSGVASTQTDTLYVVAAGPYTVSFTGTGLSYTTIFGKTLLTKGSVDEISVNKGGTEIGSFSGDIPGKALVAAYIDEVLGTDLSALEDMFLARDWTFNARGHDVSFDSSSFTGDGFAISLDGNDVVNLGSGFDRVSTGGGRDLISGAGGNDTLDGEAGKDTLLGGHGRDILKGGGQDDALYGAQGMDRLFGDTGNDLIIGGAAADYLNGQGGRDTLFGSSGNDSLLGGTGDDLLGGGRGRDTLRGGAGEDTLLGDHGDDNLFGGTGDDTLSGGRDNDTLEGDTGKDLLRGGAGSDDLQGGAGRDTLIGGRNDDLLRGGADPDLFEFALLSGDDTITDFDDIEDTIHIASTSAVTYQTFSDRTVITHSGGTITLQGVDATAAPDLAQLQASVDVDLIIV